MDSEMIQRAAAWGMTPKALAKLLECGKDEDPNKAQADPDNHHLKFDNGKIYLRVRIASQRFEQRLPDDLKKARAVRDKKLAELGFNHQLFIRNRDAYNARRKKTITPSGL
jgi:hypothetical protein